MNLLIGIGIFLTVVLLIEGSAFALRAIHNPERRRIKRRLRRWASGGYGSQDVDIVRKRVFSEVSWFNDILLKTPGVQDLGRILEQADSRYPVGVFLLSSVVLALLGLWLGSMVINNVIFQVLGAGFCGVMPFFYVYRKRQQRLRKFQRQLPETLDLIARALRAGHTLTVGMKMVGDEFPDPIGAEFDKTMAEINFGVDVPEALKNLAQRVDCPDLNFFVTSIMIQRETGGNLAEILENISHLIRKRFELQGRIQALAAEGKLSAIIMLALPFFLGLAIAFLNPEYLKLLFTDPIGKGMLGVAACMMVVGTVVMKKMIHIKV